MQRIVRGVFKDSTIIAVAHRFNPIMDFDRAALFDHGESKACDGADNALKRRSLFRRLLWEDRQRC